jgi:hypothetical protein
MSARWRVAASPARAPASQIFEVFDVAIAKKIHQNCMVAHCAQRANSAE